MTVIRAAALLVMMMIGALIWVVAAHVDRIVNGGELLGISLIVIGIYQFIKAARTA